MIVLKLKAFVTIWLFSAFPSASALTPQTVQWSTKTYGPDGPWQAVTIRIGTPPLLFDLLPGGSWMTNVLSPAICKGDQACFSSNAGFYNPNVSSTSFSIGQTGTIDNSPFTAVGALPSLFGTADWTFDKVSVPVKNGIAGESVLAEIDNFDMLVITEGYSTLPDGRKYSVQIGKLALGAPEFNQSWLHFPPNPKWNGTLLTSSLFAQGRTPSNSYGMHIGSAVVGISGSLNIGGYDQNRALAPASSQVYSIDHLPIDLLDIGIDVAEGQSPFNSTSKSGLMASGNSSIGLSMSVDVEATVPYLYLPSSTCDAIARNLPVTFQPKLGLYLWNTADSEYKTLVSSPAFLGFTFRLNSSISQNFTIKVPFALLNLNLTTPIVNTSTPYFPCSPGLGPSGHYALGRAFMQAAFVGVNWQTDGHWFLAQAPGPNTPSDTAATAIGLTDKYIIASTNQWLDTWRGAWTAISLTSPNTPSTTNSTSSSTATPSNSNSPAGLSSGAIAGIAVGGALVIIALVVAFLLYRRRTIRKQAQHSLAVGIDDRTSVDATGYFAPREKQIWGSGFGPREMDSESEARAVPRELDSGSEAVRRPIELAG